MTTAVFAQAPGSLNGNLALVGGTVYVSPTEDPIPDGVVLIQEGEIRAVGSRQSVRVPRTVRSLDCSGLLVTAGFWNSHVHFFERKWANVTTIPPSELGRQLEDTLTRFGFTTVFDTGSPWQNTRRLRDRIESAEVPGPRILSTGEALVAAGALPSETVLAVLGLMTFPAPEVTDARQATVAAQRLLDDGVDGIKIHLQPPPPPKPPLPESPNGSAIRQSADESPSASRETSSY